MKCLFSPASGRSLPPKLVSKGMGGGILRVMGGDKERDVVP